MYRYYRPGGYCSVSGSVQSAGPEVGLQGFPAFLLPVLDVLESGGRPDLTEVDGRPIGVEPYANGPDAVVRVDGECHDVVVEPAVDIALFLAH